MPIYVSIRQPPPTSLPIASHLPPAAYSRAPIMPTDALFGVSSFRLYVSLPPFQNRASSPVAVIKYKLKPKRFGFAAVCYAVITLHPVIELLQVQLPKKAGFFSKLDNKPLFSRPPGGFPYIRARKKTHVLPFSRLCTLLV